jgi:putative component of toxin-antitoxin plasmid stabilization module
MLFEIIYQTENGKEPFYDGLDTLEENIEERIQSRINRVKLGNLGDYKSLGNGILN